VALDNFGTLGIDFWGQGDQYGPIMDFYTDYTNKNYDIMSLKNSHTIGITNDESWWGCEFGHWLEPSIHLGLTCTDPNGSPHIDFTQGIGNHSRVDVRMVCTPQHPNELDFYTNCTYGQYPSGLKVMSIVPGGVVAQSVIVEATWPDFVFKSGYNLKSIEQVEKYVKENGHLEGIPTETEVASNGVNVGDTESKLLQKVEELTLYIIVQNKEINALKEKIDHNDGGSR